MRARIPPEPGGGSREALRLAPLLTLGLLGISCAHVTGGRGSATAPVVDSATVALWHMDEPGGFNVADAGEHRLVARAGGDTDTDFGRFRGARVFTRSIESFLYVPYAPALETGAALTVEAWIQPVAVGGAELTPIVARWTDRADEQSWLFGIVGFDQGITSANSPGTHRKIVQLGIPGHLVFAFQLAEASLPVSYFSADEVELNRWTHVAVTYDGQEVHFYIDGRLDSQYALAGRIRPSQAPLLFANYFDTRWITDLGDRPQVGSGVDRNPYYAFEGMIDELRISDTARSSFWR